MFDRDTGRSRGFGFVTFEDESVRQNLLSRSEGVQSKQNNKTVTQLEMRGKVIELKAAEPKQQCMMRISSRSHSHPNVCNQGGRKYCAPPVALDPNTVTWPAIQPFYHNNLETQCYFMGVPNYAAPINYYPFQMYPNYGFQSDDIQTQNFPGMIPGRVSYEHSHVFPGGPIPTMGVPYVVGSSSSIANSMSDDMNTTNPFAPATPRMDNENDSTL
jgi:RNA recognition motif-containing protein